MEFIIEARDGAHDESLAGAIIQESDELTKRGATPATLRLTGRQYLRLQAEAQELPVFDQAIVDAPTFNGMRIEIVPDPDQVGRPHAG